MRTGIFYNLSYLHVDDFGNRGGETYRDLQEEQSASPRLPTTSLLTTSQYITEFFFVEITCPLLLLYAEDEKKSLTFRWV
jgi:hypothetical protein